MSGVIVDVDGTLVDSNTAHARAWADVLQAAGFDVSVERLQRLIGMGSDKLLPAAAGIEKDSPQGKQLGERRKKVFQERYLPTLRPTPGAHELIDALRREGFRLMVASSAEGEELKALLAVCDATDLADDTPPPEQVDRSKPAPDVVEAALARLGMLASEAIMLGDTPYDVESSGRAGVGMIGVRSGGWSAEDLHGCLAVYDDPADLLAHIASSPLAR